MKKILWAACWLTACGGGGHLVRDSAPPPPKREQVAAAPDAFADHRGQKVPVGQRFRLASKPIGVEGVRVVVELTRVEWQTMTAPSGKDIREAVAHLVVRQGEDERSIRVNQNDHKSAMGARVELAGAGEEYNRQRMTDEPWVDLVVTAAPDR